MKKITYAFLASLLFLSLGSTPAPAQEELTCEDYRCQFQAQLDAECSCTEADNHGRYVSCVAHVINDLVEAGLPTNCKGKLKRCAARSVCGKQDRFSTCTTTTYNPCVDGFCANDATIACTVDTDCGVAETTCKFTRNPEACEAEGGQLNLSPTCCSTCNTAP
jgi:hypothetical protein